jgi:hypothetical protein
MENTQNQEAPVQGNKGSWPPPSLEPVLSLPIDWTRSDIIIEDNDGGDDGGL